MSIVGASFILLSFALFPASRKMSRKILVFLSLADLGSAGTWVWSTFITTQLSRPSLSCVTQGFLLQFFYLSSYVWTSCFAFHLYQLIWKRNTKVRGAVLGSRRWHRSAALTSPPGPCPPTRSLRAAVV